MQLLGSHERSRELHALHGAEEEDAQLQLWMVLWDKIRLVRGTECIPDICRFFYTNKIFGE